MWRTQMRALLDESRGLVSAEVQLDLHKAFELVNRGKLIEAAAAAGYPCDVLAWGLSMYGWARRIVFRGCVTGAMWPCRGIAAGSAFATTELWVLLCGAIGRLCRRFPLVVFTVHVDDLAGTSSGIEDEVVEEIVDVVREVRKELDEALLLVAEHKNTVVATIDRLATAVSKALGGVAECGTMVKKLGADYALGAFGPHGCRNPSRKKRRTADQCRWVRRTGDAAAAAAAAANATVRGQQPGQQKGAGLKVRAGRWIKAKRRMNRIMNLGKGRRRLFASCVLPAANYAAEHNAWQPLELERRRGLALKGHGTCPPGVPHEFAAVTMAPSADPAFSLPYAAVERWARELWMATSSGRLRPPDALTGQELAELHRLLCRGDRKVVQGPGRALMDAMRRLGITWDLPHTLQMENVKLDLTMTAPAYIKKFVAGSWAAGRRARAAAALKERWSLLETRGDRQLAAAFGAIDVEFVLDELAPGKLSDKETKALGAIVWEVLPTGQWLSRHGWRVEEACPRGGR